MALVYGRDLEVAEVVCSMLGCNISPPFVSIGVERKGEIVGGVVFNHFNRVDIEMTIASKVGLSPDFCRVLADYIFGQSKCARVTISVRAKDAKTIKLAEKFGFKREGLKRKGFGYDDAVIFGLLPEECRWLRK